MQRTPPSTTSPSSPAMPAAATPAPPQQALPREAGTPWGGMLGGALLGLGLGSQMSTSGSQPDSVTQSEGGNGGIAGSSASGGGDLALQAQQASEPVPQNKLGPLLLLTVGAAIAFIAVRRMRRRR